MKDARAFIEFAEKLTMRQGESFHERLRRVQRELAERMLADLHTIQGGGRRGGKTQAMRAARGMREEIPASFVISVTEAAKDDVLLAQYVRTVVEHSVRGVRYVEEYRVTGREPQGERPCAHRQVGSQK